MSISSPSNPPSRASTAALAKRILDDRHVLQFHRLGGLAKNDVGDGRRPPDGLAGNGPAGLKTMMIQLRKDGHIERVDGRCQPLVIGDDLGAVAFDHGLPGSVIGVDRQFAQDDQAAFAFGSSPIVGDVVVRESSALSEIGPMCQKTDTIPELCLAYRQGR